jgi:hypothetical protein
VCGAAEGGALLRRAAVCLLVVVGAGLVREALRRALGVCRPALKEAGGMRFPAWEGGSARATSILTKNIAKEVQGPETLKVGEDRRRSGTGG